MAATHPSGTYTYNWLGLQRYTVAATQILPPGKATIRFEFAYDGGGLGKGGKGALFVNGTQAATGRIERTQCCVYSADEGADVGIDEGTPVTEAYRTPFKFTGKIASVTIELKDVKAAEHDEAEHARKVAGVKKALPISAVHLPLRRTFSDAQDEGASHGARARHGVSDRG